MRDLIVGADDTRETLIARGASPEDADAILEFREKLAAAVKPCPEYAALARRKIRAQLDGLE